MGPGSPRLCWTPDAGRHPPNHVAASDALRPNWDSKNFGPNVDMPAMRVASVAPAKQRKMKVGFFRRSSSDLHTVTPLTPVTSCHARVKTQRNSAVRTTLACPWLIFQTEGQRLWCDCHRSAGGLQKPAWPQTPASLQTGWSPAEHAAIKHSLEFRGSRVRVDRGPVNASSVGPPSRGRTFS